MIKEFLEIGEIVGTHGVRGEMRVNPWCDSPDYMTKFKTLYLDSNEGCAVQVKSARPHGNIVLLTIKDVDTVEKAQKMRGKVLFMKRSDARLPKNKFFVAELIGCEVFDADNEQKCYGILTDVSRTGANDVWHIESDGKEYLIPAIPDVVVETDVAANRVTIRPLKGIFDDED